MIAKDAMDEIYGESWRRIVKEARNVSRKHIEKHGKRPGCFRIGLPRLLLFGIPVIMDDELPVGTIVSCEEEKKQAPQRLERVDHVQLR